jgi:peroxiredoxin
LTGNGTMRLARFKGKPLLLVFYNPTSVTARETLGFAQSVQTQFGKYVHVVGLSVSDDRPLVVKMHKEQSLGFPVLYGGGMRISYAVETTPKLVLVDGAGIVRGQYLGWGAETASEVLSELRRWITAP